MASSPQLTERDATRARAMLVAMRVTSRHYKRYLVAA